MRAAAARRTAMKPCAVEEVYFSDPDEEFESLSSPEMLDAAEDNIDEETVVGSDEESRRSEAPQPQQQALNSGHQQVPTNSQHQQQPTNPQYQQQPSDQQHQQQSLQLRKQAPRSRQPRALQAPTSQNQPSQVEAPAVAPASLPRSQHSSQAKAASTSAASSAVTNKTKSTAKSPPQATSPPPNWGQGSQQLVQAKLPRAQNPITCIHHSTQSSAPNDPTRFYHLEAHSHDRRITSCMQYQQMVQAGAPPYTFEGFLFTFTGYPRDVAPDCGHSGLPVYPVNYLGVVNYDWNDITERDWPGPRVSFERHPQQDPEGFFRDERDPVYNRQIFRFQNIAPTTDFETAIPGLRGLEPMCYKYELFLNLDGRKGMEKKYFYKCAQPEEGAA
ncbi:hypothetical protein TWF281_011135 [Arthrobotrys megalospora]